jgi:hypothetical protein
MKRSGTERLNRLPVTEIHLESSVGHAIGENGAVVLGEMAFLLPPLVVA